MNWKNLDLDWTKNKTLVKLKERLDQILKVNGLNQVFVKLLFYNISF